MSEENKTDTTMQVDGDKEVKGEVKAAKEEVGATAERDMMDGGFAVVDRERLIAEEMKVKVPWYKNFANLFVAPSKTMAETIEADPIKGIGFGLGWSAVLSIICILVTYMNPLQKIAMYDLSRKMGVAEEQLSQTFQLQVISGCITGAIAVAVSALITAVVLQIIKAICRDKGSFKKLFIIALLSQVVTYVISIIDALLQYFIGSTTAVLGIGSVLGAEALTSSPLLQTLASVISVGNIWGIVVLAVGYKVMTRKSTAKAIIVVAIYEVLGFGFTYGSLMISQSAMQMMG